MRISGGMFAYQEVGNVSFLLLLVVMLIFVTYQEVRNVQLLSMSDKKRDFTKENKGLKLIKDICVMHFL